MEESKFKMNRSTVHFIIVMSAWIVVIPLARGQTFTTLDSPGASSTSLTGINDSGQIVGNAPYGFLYSGGSFSSIYVSGSTFTYANGISDSGQIVGSYRYQPGTTQHGFVYSGGTFSTLDVPGSSAFGNIADDTIANGISSNGTYIVGYYITGPSSGPNPGHGFILYGGAYTGFNAPPCTGVADGTSANGVNDSGQVVGSCDSTYGFLYSGGVFSSISYPGASATVPVGINNSGEISGYYTDGSGQHGFVYTDGNYSSIDVPNSTQTTVAGIDASGDVVGSYVDASGNTNGFMYGGISGYVNPKYLIMGVTYAPPGGDSSSYVSYQTSSLVGNNTTNTSSFQSGFNESVAVGVGGDFTIFGVSAGVTVTGTQSSGWTQKTTNSTSITVNKTTSTTLKTPGVPSIYSPVDHDYDIIWLWLNPVALFTLYNLPGSGVGPIVWNGYGYDLNDPLQDIDVWPVYVGYLNGDFGPLDAQDAGALSRSWVTTQTFAPGQGPGITFADYANILGADPFANNPFDSNSGYLLTVAPGTAPPTSADGRFTMSQGGNGTQDSIPYQQAPLGSTTGIQDIFQFINQTTTMTTHTVDNTYTVGFGLEEAFTVGNKMTPFTANFSLDLKQNWTMTWENISTTSSTNTNTQTNTAQITGPPCPATTAPCNPTYTEPHEFAVYQDNLYGSLMFWPNPYFSISKVTPATNTIAAGGTASFVISTLANAGYTGTSIDISLTGLPAGATYNQITGAPGNMFTLSVSTTSSTPNGSYPLTVSATDGSQSYFAYATLVVNPPLPNVSLNAASVSFGDQALGTTSSPSALTVTNNGTVSLTFTSIAATGDFAVAATGTTCIRSTPVAASGSCVINVTFTPTATGSRSGSLTLNDNASGSPQTVSLSGTGTGPTVSLSASPSFPSEPVGTTSSSQTVTLTNTGNASLTFSNIAAAGPFAIATSGTTCSTSNPVAAAATCTVAVTFTPAAGGAASGSLSFSDNASGSPQSVALNGTGQDFSFAPPSGSSTSATVAPGSAAIYTLSVGGEGGLSGAVNFTCAGAPSEATCTVSPNPATAGGSATNVTVTVTTAAPSVTAPRSRHLPPVPPLSPGLRGLLMFVLVLAAMAWALRRRNHSSTSGWRSTTIPIIAGLLLILALAACGGGGSNSSGPPPNPGTPAGTYPLTVTGTTGSGSSALSHSVTLTLTVS